MKQGLKVAFFMVLCSGFCGLAVQGYAQQSDKEIAKNQVEQVKRELEDVSNEVAAADSENEAEYLESQSQAQKDAELAQQQIDSEIEALQEQTNQDSAQLRESFTKEEEANIKQAMQEFELQTLELEEQAQIIESDNLDQE
ncbi:MAG: hypothetical protein KJ915_13285 [Candidatus Omnitrophica bacterium]|nr:hypothetical protein [Candidatus Omnitrophota bacterium]